MTGWREYLEEHRDRFLREAVDFMSIPSVSGLRGHRADVRRAAEWVTSRVRAAGIEDVRLFPTDGHPIVYAQRLDDPQNPTILIYGHFDTQPADPLELWTSPPFEPRIDHGRIYARGASDDKGNMLIPIVALEAVLASAGELPVNVKLLFEGEEEIGSMNLGPFLRQNRELLRCDLVVSADGGQYSEDQPHLIVSCRGLCAVQVDVRGPATDLHSGLHGGAVQNPIAALVEVLATMRSQDGTILVDGFYDDVRPLSPAERRAIATAPLDEATYRQRIGVAELFGEPGYSTPERVGARPTLELNGIWGGFQGEGPKTLIPREAHAKISCRLVADQEPARIVELIVAHVHHHRPAGVDVTVAPLRTQAKPYRIPLDHQGNRAAREVLTEVYGKEPHPNFAGASLPVCELFLSELGTDTVFFAFGLEDEGMHAPNEFFRIASFERGQTAYCMLLERLGGIETRPDHPSISASSSTSTRTPSEMKPPT